MPGYWSIAMFANNLLRWTRLNSHRRRHHEKTDHHNMNVRGFHWLYLRIPFTAERQLITKVDSICNIWAAGGAGLLQVLLHRKRFVMTGLHCVQCAAWWSCKTKCFANKPLLGTLVAPQLGTLVLGPDWYWVHWESQLSSLSHKSKPGTKVSLTLSHLFDQK